MGQQAKYVLFLAAQVKCVKWVLSPVSAAKSFVTATLRYRISHTYGLFFFGKKVLRFFLFKGVWYILFWKSGPLYGLLSAYELLKNFFILTHFK